MTWLELHYHESPLTPALINPRQITLIRQAPGGGVYVYMAGDAETEPGYQPLRMVESYVELRALLAVASVPTEVTA